jgi:hypothetical protein
MLSKDETDYFADRTLSNRSTNSQSESSIGQKALQIARQIREAHAHLNFSFGACYVADSSTITS